MATLPFPVNMRTIETGSSPRSDAVGKSKDSTIRRSNRNFATHGQFKLTQAAVQNSQTLVAQENNHQRDFVWTPRASVKTTHAFTLDSDGQRLGLETG